MNTFTDKFFLSDDLFGTTRTLVIKPTNSRSISYILAFIQLISIEI